MWISSEAEFTPTPIQTREERADLVYAVKIRVANPEGMLKIGMPVDVHFRLAAACGTHDRRRGRSNASSSVSATTTALDGISFAVRRGRALRLHRSGRRRQDDAVPHPGHAARSRRGQRARARPRRGRAICGDLRRAIGLHAGPLFALSRPQRRGEPARSSRLCSERRSRRSTSTSRRSTRSSSPSGRAARARSRAG